MAAAGVKKRAITLQKLIIKSKTEGEFLEGWNKIKDNTTMEVLLYEGEHQGMTALYLAAWQVTEGCPAAFAHLHRHFRNQLTLEHFLKRGKSGLFPLWLLAMAIRSNSGPFKTVLGQFINSITADVFLLSPHEGPHEGAFILWFAAQSAHVTPFFLRIILAKFKKEFQAKDYLKGPQGRARGKTLLWVLGFLVEYHPAFFMHAFEQHKDEFTIEEFLAQVLDGENKGQSVVWQLAYAANKYPEAFIAFWVYFGKQLKLSDLLVEALAGKCQGESSLSLLADAALTQPAITIILGKILYRLPGIIPNVDPLKEILVKFTNGQHLINLVLKRNAFFQAFEQFKAQVQISDESFTELCKLADEAQSADYVNAYYDIGLYLLTRNEEQKAAFSFDRTHPKSTFDKEVRKRKGPTA
ncbi:MAG: hypothetical protein ACHQJ6_02555 [Candidatus Berkiellales bacterium]